MSLHAALIKGSGRATCKLCDKLIKKDQKQISMSGYQTSGAVHSNPFDCIKERWDVTDMIMAVATKGGKQNAKEEDKT